MSSDTHSYLHGLEAHILRFVCEVETPLRLYAHKGSALRGAWVEALLSKACPQPWACAGASCKMPHGCPIAALVGPADEVGERGRDVPRPYIVEPPLDSRTDYAPGDTLEWRMVLVGKAAEWFPYVVMATLRMGERGMGVGTSPNRQVSNGAGIGRAISGRGRFLLREIWADNPLDGKQVRLYNHNERRVNLPQLPVTNEQVTAIASALPWDRITLHFRTPLRIGQGRYESGGERKLTHDLPPFHTLISRLDGRLRDLVRHYAPVTAREGETKMQPVEPDRLDMGKARQVVAEGAVEWLDLQRYSSRQERRLPMGGLVGRVTYAGDLSPFLSLLVWGQFVHVGKYAVMGNGKYEIETSNPMR